MADQVDNAIQGLKAIEGGYTNNPLDKGGPTNWGITEHVARAHGYTGNMLNLPWETAAGIYRAIYWNEPKFGEVYKRLSAVALELFDTGVNMGPKKAAMFLQRALNVLNQGSLTYPNLTPDGDVGNMTLYALDHLIAKRGSAATNSVLMKMLNAEQIVRYIEIAEANPSQETFMFGWVQNRG